MPIQKMIVSLAKAVRTFGFAVMSFGLILNANAGTTLYLKNVTLPTAQPQRGILGKTPRTFESLASALIQFESTPSQETLRHLEARGARIVRYVPDDALWVRLPSETSADASALLLESLPGVRFVTAMRPEWKLDSELVETAGISEWIWVLTLPGEDTAQLIQKLRLLPGVSDARDLGRDVLVRARPTAYESIAAQEEVEWVAALPLLTTFDFKIAREDLDVSEHQVTPPTPTGFESGTKLMGFEAAWARGYTGAGQKVAIGDTGVDLGDINQMHPDLKAVTDGEAAGMGSTTWSDPQGHGTHVAGSIVASGVSSNGLIKGGAFDAELYAQGLWSPILDNLAFNTDLRKLFGSASAKGAVIHSNSWGGVRGLGNYDAMASRADEFMWTNPEVLVLFAAGNSGEDKDRDGRVDTHSISSPGTAKNVLTVGASENFLLAGGNQKTLAAMRDGEKKWGVEPLRSDTLSNNSEGLAAFSSRGPTNDGRLKPEVVAPGTNIVSTQSRVPNSSTLWGVYDANYSYAGGTSMATPLTAGAAAVVRQYLQKERGIQKPSAALMKAALMHTAQDLFPGQYGRGITQEIQTLRPNVHEGFGRVNVDAATGFSRASQILDETVGVASGEAKSITVRFSKPGTLVATLVYTDAPATAAAARALVNDLRLEIRTPTGRFGARSRPLLAQAGDGVNNSAHLEREMAPGTYEISVVGQRVTVGKAGRQPYALIVSTTGDLTRRR